MFKNDHIAIFVKDVDISRHFYEYIGGRVVSQPSNKFLEILLGEVRLHILPLPDQALANQPLPAQALAGTPRLDHLCFQVESLDDLVFLQAKINSFPSPRPHEPYVIKDSPPLAMDGKSHCEQRPPRKTLYFEDPDGIKLEARAYN